jgi:hypothetical protein
VVERLSSFDRLVGADGTGLRKFLGCVIFATLAGSMIHPWIRGEAMSERDLTAREDRFLGLCLVAGAIIVVFAFILYS